MCKSLSQLEASDETNTEIILGVSADWIWKWVPQKSEGGILRQPRGNSCRNTLPVGVGDKEEEEGHRAGHKAVRAGRQPVAVGVPLLSSWIQASIWTRLAKRTAVPATLVTGVRRNPIGAVFGAVFLCLHSRVCIVWLLSFHSTNI